MIVVDTSALMAIILGEQNADDYLRQLKHSEVVISTASLVEAYVVAKRKAGEAGVEDLNRLVQDYQIAVTSFDVSQVGYAQSGFDRYGKGRGAEPAALNSATASLTRSRSRSTRRFCSRAMISPKPM